MQVQHAGEAGEGDPHPVRTLGCRVYVAGRYAPASDQSYIHHFPTPSKHLAKPITTGIVRMDISVETATNADGKRPSPPCLTENIVTLAPPHFRFVP